MTWVTVSDDDKPILEEIEKQTDRAAALIAVAYLEQRLLAAIQARTCRFKDVENKLYKGSGPLGPLSVKIDLALLLGIYDEGFHKMLHTIREIRNDFAHEAKPISFKTDRVLALCKNIEIAVNLEGKNKTTGQEFKIHIQPDGTPRTAFMNAVKFFLVLFDMETKQLPLRAPAKPVMTLQAQP